VAQQCPEWNTAALARRSIKREKKVEEIWGILEARIEWRKTFALKRDPPEAK